MHRPALLLVLLATCALPAPAQEDPLAPPLPGTEAEQAPPPPPRGRGAPPPTSEAPPPAPREEERAGTRDAARARTLNLPNRIGLSGFGDMIDARVPKDTVALRGGVRYRAQLSERDVEAGGEELERHEFPLYAGASLFGLLDAGMRVSYVVREEQIEVNGGSDDELDDSGWADMELGGKVSLDLWLLSLGAYVQGRIPLDTEVTRLSYVDAGVTGTFAFWDDRIALHGNLSALFIEEGTQALKYRVGVSVVPLALDLVTLRAFAYLDGMEYEGSPGNDLDVKFGVQGIFFGFLTAELSFGVRALDSGYVDDDLRDALDQAGLADRSVSDDGTWEVELGAGLQFAF